MNYPILTKTLLKLGLTSFEAKVYEFLVTNPEVSVTEIAKEFSTNRINIYRAMEILESKGLVSKDETQKKLKYHILTPTKIQSLLQFEEIEFSRLNRELDDAMPYILDNFYLDKKEPKVQIFEGRRDFMILLNRMVDELVPNSDILWMAEGEELYSVVGQEYFNQELASKANKKNVKAKILAGAENDRILNEKMSKELNYQFKKLPKGFSTIGTISIAGDKVVFWNTINPRAVLIDDATISTVFKDLFDFVWDKSY
jgi:sugar-specific transcriptional regulator TrmB